MGLRPGSKSRKLVMIRSTITQVLEPSRVMLFETGNYMVGAFVVVVCRVGYLEVGSAVRTWSCQERVFTGT